MMSENTPTITLKIENLDGGAYPLRLLFHGENGLEERAYTSIPKEEFERNNTDKWDFDPIEKFLDEPDESGDFKKIGAKLYSLISSDDVGEKWKNFTGANKLRCRVQLDIEPAEVAVFPWELVYKDNKEWLATDKNQTFIRRYEPSGEVSEMKENSSLLRVLIVVGVDKNDTAVLPWQEVRRIESIIHNQNRDATENRLTHRIIDIEVLEQPDLDTLIEKYEEIKPHIFHFIGHGGLNADGDSYLLLTYPGNDGTDQIEWTYDMIAGNFKNVEILPRFVFINACRSQNKQLSQEDLKRQAWSIGDVFRDLNVPAVLTMQADIGGADAGIFSEAIYKSLAKLEPLDAALGAAREAMLNKIATTRKRDWAIPVLTVAAPPEEILPFKPKASEELMKKIKSCSEFVGIEYFIDRIVPRRQLIQGFFPLPPGVPDKNLTVVSGKESSGKSWLVTWCLEVCALLNHDVRYVMIGGDRSKTWLDVLLQIRRGNKEKRSSLLIYDELEKTVFEQFYWELEHRFKNSVGVPPRNNAPVIPKDDYQLADSKLVSEHSKETIESFLQALAQTAQANNPLIIVLDQFKGISESDMKELIEHLIEPVAAGKVNSVKFILVLTEDELENFEIKKLVSSYRDVPIKMLEPNTFFEMASEYLRKLIKIQGLKYTEEEIERAADGVAIVIKKKNQAYSPSEFKKHFM